MESLIRVQLIDQIHEEPMTSFRRVERVWLVLSIFHVLQHQKYLVIVFLFLSTDIPITAHEKIKN